MATPIYPLVDRILDGRLADELRARRSDGDSFQTIARWLEREHDISVTTETVRKWCADTSADVAA